MFLFEIYTLPKPQQQTKYAKKIFYDPSKSYKDALIWQMRPYAPREPLYGPVFVDISFYLPIPKNTPKAKYRNMVAGNIYPVVRPDIDNLAYVVTNAMKQLFYQDDAQIVDLCLHKRYHETPKIVIKILTNEELCHS